AALENSTARAQAIRAVVSSPINAGNDSFPHAQLLRASPLSNRRLRRLASRALPPPVHLPNGRRGRRFVPRAWTPRHWTAFHLPRAAPPPLPNPATPSPGRHKASTR